MKICLFGTSWNIYLIRYQKNRVSIVNLFWIKIQTLKSVYGPAIYVHEKKLKTPSHPLTLKRHLPTCYNFLFKPVPISNTFQFISYRPVVFHFKFSQEPLLSGLNCFELDKTGFYFFWFVRLLESWLYKRLRCHGNGFERTCSVGFKFSSFW